MGASFTKKKVAAEIQVVDADSNHINS